MLRRSAGQTNGPEKTFAAAIVAISCVLTALALLPGVPNIAGKERAMEADNTVSLVVDYEDLLSFQSGTGLAGSLEALRVLPVSIVFARADLPKTDEKLIRDFGFSILWRLEDGVPPDTLLPRLGPRDSVVAAGERSLDAPRYPQRLAEVLKRLNGYLAVIEFAPIRAVDELVALSPERLVRCHMISARETFTPDDEVWTQRAVRACRERWVRMVCFRYSSNWSNDQNVDYLRTLAGAIRRHGFVLGWPAPVPSWEGAAQHIPGRIWLALFLGIMGPLAVIAVIAQSKKPLPIPVFTLICLWSVCVGTAVHGLLASPLAAAGVEIARGVKAQLLIPLVLGTIFLLTRAEIRAFLGRPIHWRDLVFGMTAVAIFLGVYLMRSGNLPTLQVTDMERGMRDVLETIFGARPRFKESVIGHPLLIAGLNRFRRQRGGGFFKDGRAMIAVGMIGPISIINTFAHVAAPYEVGLLRTFHGFWIGVLLSIPLSWWLERRFKRRPDGE